MVQIADEPHLVCDQHTRGAMKFTESCFCACIQEGSEHRWVNMTPSETCATRCPSSASSAGSSSTAPATSPKLCPPASDLPPRGLNQSISQGSCANGATPSSPQAGTNAWTRNCTLNGKTESCSVACAAGLEIDAHTQVCTPALQPVNASCHPSMQAISAGNTLTTTTAVLCQAGTLKPNSIHADPTTKSRNWICEGIAGGNNQNCNISCATGSVMVLSNGSYSCQTPACTGTLPQSALMYASAGENAPATVLPWQYSASDTPRKCEFRCQDGYNWNGSACVINQYTVTAESNTTAWGSVTPSSKTLAH